MSISRWIADQVLKSLENTWPPGVLEAAGAFPDFPAVEDLRKGYGEDASRESVE